MAETALPTTRSSHSNLTEEKEKEIDVPHVPENDQDIPITDVEKVASKAPEQHQDGGAVVQRPPGFQWFLICLAVYSSALLYGLDTTISSTVQDPVVETFGSVDKLGWLGIGFPLGSIATILSQ
jgi:hypothetical protein